MCVTNLNHDNMVFFLSKTKQDTKNARIQNFYSLCYFKENSLYITKFSDSTLNTNLPNYYSDILGFMLKLAFADQKNQ